MNDDDPDIKRVAAFIALAAFFIALGAFGWELVRPASDDPRCAAIPNSRYIACRSAESPKDWQEKNCFQASTAVGGRLAIWSCPD